MKKIIIDSIEIRYTVESDEPGRVRSVPVHRVFTEEDKSLPGIIKDMFRDARFFLLHDIARNAPPPPPPADLDLNEQVRTR